MVLKRYRVECLDFDSANGDSGFAKPGISKAVRLKKFCGLSKVHDDFRCRMPRNWTAPLCTCAVSSNLSSLGGPWY